MIYIRQPTNDMWGHYITCWFVKNVVNVELIIEYTFSACSRRSIRLCRVSLVNCEFVSTTLASRSSGRSKDTALTGR